MCLYMTGILYVWLTCKNCRDPAQVYENRLKIPAVSSAGDSGDYVDYAKKYALQVANAHPYGREMLLMEQQRQRAAEREAFYRQECAEVEAEAAYYQAYQQQSYRNRGDYTGQNHMTPGHHQNHHSPHHQTSALIQTRASIAGNHVSGGGGGGTYSSIKSATPTGGHHPMGGWIGPTCNSTATTSGCREVRSRSMQDSNSLAGFQTCAL